MKRLLLFILLGLLFPMTAIAAEPSQDWDGGYGLINQRRSGFAIGADVGLGLGNSNGYPKDAVKLGDPRYEVDTGFGAGGIGRLWLGGTIRDWFSFGLGYEMLSIQGNDVTASGNAFLLRPELYPLWSLGGLYRDLGVYTNFGLGWLKGRKNSAVVADGGSLGVVGIGLFHETLRVGHLAVGPTLGCALYFSETMTATLGQVGLRVAFTTGP